jgi:hypothetical protein
MRPANDSQRKGMKPNAMMLYRQCDLKPSTPS